jgi:predicted DNA-binding transcriptional regulator AlpA
MATALPEDAARTPSRQCSEPFAPPRLRLGGATILHRPGVIHSLLLSDPQERSAQAIFADARAGILPRLVTITEVAAALGLSITSIRRLISRHQFVPLIRLSRRRIAFRRRDILAWIRRAVATDQVRP